MTPLSGLGSSPTSSSPRTQLISEFLSIPVVPVIAVAPDALGVQDGVIVVEYVNVFVPVAVIENVPTYADSLAPTGLPAMLTELPVLNGLVDDVVVAVTVLVGVGVDPVQATVRVSKESVLVAVRSTFGVPPASGVAGVVVIE